MQDLDFVLDKVYRSTKIPLRYISGDGKLVLHARGYEHEQDPVMHDEAFCEFLMHMSIGGNVPQLYIENDMILHSSFWDIGNNSCVIVGPVCSQGNDDIITLYADRHNLEDACRIRQRTLDVFLAAVCLLYYCILGKPVQEAQISPPKNEHDFDMDAVSIRTKEYMMDNVENEFSRLSYHDERIFLSGIRNGNVAAVKGSFDMEHLKRIPRLAENEHKHYEYMICSAVTLATRAAISGGLDASTAYAMSDLYLRALEHSKGIDEMFELHKNMMISFATKVHENKQSRSRNSVVEKAKNFIQNNVNKKFTLDDIAAETNVSKAHLSRIFGKETGMGINQYTHQVRVEAASNMLKYSQVSIAQIAIYLCFPSQSHFGKIFKQHTGLTPQQFRNKEKVSDTL